MLNNTNYTPDTLNQRLEAAGKSLASELEADQAVIAAKTAYEKAQSALEQAQAAKPAWPGNASKHKLAAWHAAVNDIAARKVFVSEAEVAFRKAVNDAASSRYSRRLQAERDQQREKREADQARHSAVEEEVARSQAETRWLQAGGTAESFATAWPSLWSKELERRVQAAQEQGNRAYAARVRGAF